MKLLGRLFERALWGSRLAVLVAVVFGTLLSLGAFYLATVDAFFALGYVVQYAEPGLASEEREALRANAVTTIVKAVDEYLIAAILIIFSLGLYELFVSKLEAAERLEAATRLLLIRSLDQLKERIAGLVLLVLAIEFFQRALRLEYESALDLLFFAAGALLVSGALYLATKKSSGREAEGRAREEQ